MRLAALTARSRDVVLSDAWRAYREHGLVALALGAATALAVAILASNIVIGAALESIVGWALFTIALSGLIAIWVVSFPAWLLLVDPDRERESVRERLRLAGLLALAAPGRCAALAIVLTAILAVSTIAFAALITISVAYACLVTARYLLPLSDRLESWLEARSGSSERHKTR
jgi:uncharacterized membrane protein YesL